MSTATCLFRPLISFAGSKPRVALHHFESWEASVTLVEWAATIYLAAYMLVANTVQRRDHGSGRQELRGGWFLYGIVPPLLL